MTIDETIARLEVVKEMLVKEGSDGGSYPISVIFNRDGGMNLVGVMDVALTPAILDGIGVISVCILSSYVKQGEVVVSGGYGYR